MQLLCGDCLDILPTLSENSVDLVLADLPYGLTQAKWDCEINLEKLWEEYKRIGKINTPFVLFASQPFTSKLIISNIEHFKYCWYWVKEKGTGFLNAKIQPLRKVEEICVFYKKQCAYFPQMIPLDKPKTEYLSTKPSEQLGKIKSNTDQPIKKIHHAHYPTNVLNFCRDKKNRIHSTQKPLSLIEYLICTYTKEGDTVLDNVAGSFTTGVACAKLNRKFIGIELDKNYFDAGTKRIKLITNNTKSCKMPR